MNSLTLLSVIVFLPTLSAALLLAMAKHGAFCRWLSLAATGAVLLLVTALFWLPGAAGPGPWSMGGSLPWMSRFGIEYRLSCDSISLLLILLTALLSLLAVLVSWQSIRVGRAGRAGVHLFHASLLLAETAMLGIFLAGDLFLFYLFWEFQLLPIFLLIGRWGHENRIRAALKFLLFSISGSLFMLAGLIGLYLAHGTATGRHTLSLAALLGTPLDPAVEPWLFAAFAIAFAVKIPLVPIHTWLPDAHTEAPKAGSVILAGLLLKTGAYGLLRFAFPLFPAAAAGATPLLLILGVAGLGYSTWIAMAQKDMKRLVAYSSIGHMGLVVMGIAAWNSTALTGALVQMVNHGITTAALFILVGMLDERAGSRNLADFGGLWRSMPVFSGFFLLFALSSLGLPGLNNFIGEIMILLGLFRTWPVLATLAFGATVLILVYVLRLVQELLFGPGPAATGRFEDLTAREIVILLPLAAGTVGIGVYPLPLLRMLAEPVRLLLAGG